MPLMDAGSLTGTVSQFHPIKMGLRTALAARRVICAVHLLTIADVDQRSKIGRHSPIGLLPEAAACGQKWAPAHFYVFLEWLPPLWNIRWHVFGKLFTRCWQLFCQQNWQPWRRHPFSYWIPHKHLRGGCQLSSVTPVRLKLSPPPPQATVGTYRCCRCSILSWL